MTEQEAFEAWWASTNTVGMVTTAEAGWNAALAWLRSQGEPVGYTTQFAIKFGNFTTSPKNLWGDKGVPLFLDPQPAIPDGWRLVPKEPTQEMVIEGCRSIHCPVSGTDEPYYTYRAMLAAAPEPSKLTARNVDPLSVAQATATPTVTRPCS